MRLSSYIAKSFSTKSCFVPDGKFSVQSVWENALGKTRLLFRGLYGKKTPTEVTRGQHKALLCVTQYVCRPSSWKLSSIAYRPGTIREITSKWVKDSLAAYWSREMGRRFLQKGRGPMLCFIGCAMAQKPSLLTDEEANEGVAYLIRESFASISEEKNESYIIGKFQQKGYTLGDLIFDKMISKGCNAAVYSACLNTDSDINSGRTSSDESSTADDDVKKQNSKSARAEDNDVPTFSKLIIPHSGVLNFSRMDKKVSPSREPPEEFGPYNLAVKVMFNYNAESNASAIWNAMYKETLPVLAGRNLDLPGRRNTERKKLKPHPNIVKMLFALADQLPLLPDALKNFPQALPVRLLSEGCGRNMTLFLVMKRYHCSLKDHLRSQSPPPRTSLLLLTQLLEALAHLSQSGVAHRDLKADNILLDLTEGVLFPKLAITDFGCCLESLQLDYRYYDMTKGGNLALMAPEVVTAEVGPFSKIDYSRSDLWTGGTLAYEIYGCGNPFYCSGGNLKSDSYSESDLPPFPDAAPAPVHRLVKHILQKDPSTRPSPSFAATVCQILLHAPANLLCEPYTPKTCRKALQWMFLLSAQTYLEATCSNAPPSSVEFELRRTFCSRIQYLEVLGALKYILEA